MNQLRSIQFHPADNPTFLSKVGNWVITFITDQTIEHTQLALTNVIPRQIQDELQVRKFIIENTLQDQIWNVNSIECFSSSTLQSFELDLSSDTAEHFLQQLIVEFERYDVDVKFVQAEYCD